MKSLILFSVFATILAAGQWEEIRVDSQEVSIVTDFAVKSLSMGINSPYHSKLTHLHKAEKQIVAGINYRLELNLGLTTCKKSEVKYEELDNCGFQEEEFKRCTIEVYRDFENNYSVRKFNCRKDTKYESTSLNADKSESQLFDEFVAKHNRVYKDDEEKLARFKIFQENLKKIKLLNDNENGTARYGATKFADWTEDEFRKTALGFRPDLLDPNNVAPSAEIPQISLPDGFDWRDKKIVTGVKNQGQCGSCWAFSTTGNIEGQWALKTKNLVSLSEQELVDCDTVDEGCDGGLPSNAYKQIIKLGGLEGEKDYPYEAKDDKCELNKNKIKAYINGSVTISKNETEMAQWLLKNGPISIGINANAMQFYIDGISHPPRSLCNPDDLNHGVLIVGFGLYIQNTLTLHKKHIPYWNIKNSWGATWGQRGYYLVYRGDGTCGVNLMATSSVVD